MMKKRFFYAVLSLYFFLPPVCVWLLRGSRIRKSRLIDYDGNEISLDSNIPYSPKNTCGECHDYDAITNAYHFQQGRTDADGNIIVGRRSGFKESLACLAGYVRQVVTALCRFQPVGSER
jgi:hypothetical protein